MSKFYSTLTALLGMMMYSSGIVIQKKGSEWMGLKKRRGKEFFKLFALWLTGVLISYVVSVIPTGIASMYLPPYVVGSMSGIGIAVIIILSYFFLHEKLFVSDIVYSAVIVIGIFVISFFQNSTRAYHINKDMIYIFIFLPFLLLIPALLKYTDKKVKTILFSSFSGLMGGAAVVVLNITMKESGTSLKDIAGSMYTYIYTLSGFASAVGIQAAYRFGDIVIIAPTQVSFSIIYPVICSYFIFGSSISVIQIAAITIIIVCCKRILGKH